MDFSRVKESLTGLGYAVSEFKNKEEAMRYLCDNIKGRTIAFGGSVTLRQMNAFDRLSVNNTVYWHWRLPEGAQAADIRRLAMNTQLYFSSVNALAETGEIINIDGNCNRTAGIQFGHKKVYFVVGENKIAPDIQNAIHRARNIAAPRNAFRLKVKTPCALRGDRCYNCSSPDRICRSLSVLWCAPKGCDYEVILVHERLGY